MPSNYFNNPFLTIRQESKLASAAGNIRAVKDLLCPHFLNNIVT